MWAIDKKILSLHRQNSDNDFRLHLKLHRTLAINDTYIIGLVGNVYACIGPAGYKPS